jgi:hypothetical protein
MAFILTNPGGSVISFAEYSDVTDRDQRIFEANEGLTEVVIEDILTRSTERIISLFSTSDWWRAYYIRQSAGTYDPLLITSGLVSVPSLDADKIKARTADFTDLCVYHALANYILPKIADFSSTDTAERVKIGFYNEKFRSMFQELIDDGSWYDFSGNGTISNLEKMPIRSNVVRFR